MRARILVVDDDALLRRALARALRDYELVLASGVAEALEVLARDPEVDLVLSDFSLSDGDGAELAAEVERRWPALRRRIAFLTGGAVHAAQRAFLARPDVRWLGKPVRADALRRFVADALAAAEE